MLAELKILSPGAVFGGSAVFALDGVTHEQVKKLKSVQLVAVDHSGNEATRTIDIRPEWLEQLDITTVPG